jgi:Na+-transporting methylmalonyl-CoA/oxaloacetate decarboxylase gamma subunit
MPVDTLLQASVELMIVGMGTVFIILGLMIVCMNLLCLIAPTDESTTSCTEDKPIIAAIQSAIHQYRNHTAHKTAV